MSPASQLRVSASALSRRYSRRGETVAALDGVDLRASAGEIAGVVGRSGSGKTTLLALIGLLDRPSAGRLVIDGRDVSGLGPGALARWRRGRIGFLFQDAGLIERMGVLHTVMMPMGYAGVGGRARRARALAALERLDMADMARRRVGELSGGERQRVGLARALALQPRILICDEPTAALDRATSGLVAEVLAEQAGAGACVIVATHDPLLSPVLTRTIALEAGRVSDQAVML